MELGKYVAGKVSEHKHLRGGVHVVDAIPKSATGKILRRILKDQVLCSLCPLGDLAVSCCLAQQLRGCVQGRRMEPTQNHPKPLSEIFSRTHADKLRILGPLALALFFPREST